MAWLPRGRWKSLNSLNPWGSASIWVGEHVVLPKPRRDKPPLDPDWPMADPLVQLSFLAAATTDIRLCTGVLMATQHQPVRLAKQAATLDVLSQRRFVMGLGLGYLDLEFEVLGLPTTQRRARYRECIEAMKSLWTDESPKSSTGDFVSFSGSMPSQTLDTRWTPACHGWRRRDVALDDAARFGSGWYGFGLLPDVPRTSWTVSTPGCGPPDAILANSRFFMTPRVRLDRTLIKEYERAGVDELVVSAEARDIAGIKRRLNSMRPPPTESSPPRPGAR